MSAHKIIGERHFVPSRMAVNVAYALQSEPPVVLIAGLNSKGRVVATAPMRFEDWHHKYITQQTIDHKGPDEPSKKLLRLLDRLEGRT